MFVGSIEARAYCRATEIAERVEAAIHNLFPEHVLPSIKTTTSQAEGHIGDRILLIISKLEKKKLCDEVLNHVLIALSETDRQRIENSLDHRVDDKCTVFLRIDKQAALLEKLQLTTEPDVILLRIQLRDYPRCDREDAKDMIIDRLRNAGGRRE